MLAMTKSIVENTCPNLKNRGGNYVRFVEVLNKEVFKSFNLERKAIQFCTCVVQAITYVRPLQIELSMEKMCNQVCALKIM